MPTNFGTNTFVFDTVSFLSILTLVVFLVRVFSRVLRSNSVQRITVASDPSLSRSLETDSDSVTVTVVSDMDTRAWRRRRSISEIGTEQRILPGEVWRRRRRRPPRGGSGQRQNDPWLEEWRTDSQPGTAEINVPRLEDTVLDALRYQELSSEANIAPLDRRRHLRSRREGRQLGGGQRQTAGIGGVSYQDIYLAIGVAATALFIIETLYKTYQLYSSSTGRSLEDGWVNLVESQPWQDSEL